MSENLIKQIKKKDGSEYPKTTKQAYTSLLKMILKLADKNDTDYLKDNDVSDYINNSNLSISTKKQMFSLLVILQTQIFKNDKLMKIYIKNMNKAKGLESTVRQNNKIQNRHSEKWTTWKEIENVFDKIPEETFDDIQSKIIVGLYTRLNDYVLRLDFGDVIVCEKQNSKRKNNWLLLNDKKMVLNINKYKTARIYGPLKIEIKDEKLNKLIRKWFDKFNKEKKYLLVKKNDNYSPIGESLLSKNIKETFKKYLNKEITNQLLRQIKETEIIKDPNYQKLSLNERIKKHEKLTHSYQTAHMYMKNSDVE